MATNLRRILSGRGRRALLALLVAVVMISGVSTVVFFQTRHARAATPNNMTLLMIHGFDDNCHDIFQELQVQDSRNISAGKTPKPTVQFFTYGGWDAHQIQLVGYYSQVYKPGESSCNVNLNIMGDSTVGQVAGGDFSNGRCSAFTTTTGTIEDSIRHLGCLLAWYIATVNSRTGPVVILAHSMGGLIVRDALGEAGHTGDTGGFPSVPLDVRQVVTVGTPHGGVRGWYMVQGHNGYGDPGPRELRDMDPGSNGSGFMSMLTGDLFQAPRGSHNAQWSLIAGSVLGKSPVIVPIDFCFSQPTGTSSVSCAAEALQQNDPYPDGDGVVQADSALSMRADEKILYGGVSVCPPVIGCHGIEIVYTLDTSVNYSHEANSCLKDHPDVCLSPEFLLNDGTPGLNTALAWVCSSACNAGAGGTGGIADLHVDDGSHPNVHLVSHSLVEMLYLLPPPPPLISADGVATSNSPWAVWVTGSYFSRTLIASLTDVNGQNWGGNIATVYGNSGLVTFSLPSNQAPSGCNAGASPCTISLALIDTVNGNTSAGAALVLPATYGVVDVPGGGQFNAKWQQYGAGAGILGYPLETWQSADGGQRQRFAGTGCGPGGIFWSAPTGTFEVDCGIYQKYKALGETGSVLGFPKSDEQSVAGGAVSYFYGGGCSPADHISAIYWSGATGAHEVHGCIYYRYGGMGGPAYSGLGFPTSDQNPVAGGAYSTFQGGTMYWSSASGAHFTIGGIGAKYSSLGGPSSALGFPTSDEFGVAGGTMNSFQSGGIYWSGGTGVREVHGPIYSKYLGMNGPSGVLGFPTSDVYATGSGTESDYQYGVIVRYNDGHIVVYY